MMTLRSALPPMAALFLLTACSAQNDARPEHAAPPPQEEQGTCGAQKVASYVGRLPTDDVLAQIKSASGAQTIRVVGPNDAMTMDFRQDRLTISTDEDGRIKSMRCV